MRDWIETLHTVLAALVLMAALHALWWTCTSEPPPLTACLITGYFTQKLINLAVNRRAAAEIDYLQASHDLPDYIHRDRGTT